MSEQVLEPSLRTEVPPTPEQSGERPNITIREQPVPIQEQTTPTQQTPALSSAMLPRTKDPQLTEIESILADGLDQAYMSLSEAKRQEFRTQGELLAQAIQTMIQKGRINIKKIRNLIIKWLRVIPGVNRYFLEQEAKIKADRLTELHPDT